MGATAFLGFLLLAAGPPLVIWCTIIARKSFLVLLALASAFYWLVTLILISIPFSVFEPLPQNAAAYAAALTVAVVFQEGARYGAFLVHRIILQQLHEASRQLRLPKVTTEDRRLLALTHGMGHAIAQTTFLYYSFNSLAAGKGTMYIEACPQMSYFLAAGLLSLAFFLLHTFSMIVAFQGYETHNLMLTGAVGGLHLLTALTTLFNMVHGGCVPTITVTLLEGSLAVAAAGALCWCDPIENSSLGTVPEPLESEADGL